jgi:AAA domain/PhoH-like protein
MEDITIINDEQSEIIPSDDAINTTIEQETQELPTFVPHVPTLPAFSSAALAWLNALPNYPDTTDIFTLNENNFAIKCVRELLENKTFEMTIAANHPASEWLNHFYFESKNKEKVFGTKNFGVGYPLVIADIENYHLAAPLFIWQLAIEPHVQNIDHWLVQNTENQAIVPNYPLFHLIDSLHGTDFTSRVVALAESKRINTQTLTELADGIRLLLNLQEQGLSLSIMPCPGESEIETLMQQKTLYWSGVIGLFPSIPMSMTAQTPVIAPNLPAALDWKHTFSVLPMDATQRSILQSVQNNAITVVEGASGTGKTYTISNILINALSNGKKCLVVSKSVNALRRAQKFVLDKGFGDLTFILRDTVGDKLMLADMLRAAAEHKTKVNVDEELHKTVMNRSLRETRKLDDAWEALHAPVFGEQSFVDTVGRFLRSNRIEGKELLLSQLTPTDFQFNKEEFDNIVTAIRASEPIFKKFPTLSHPLAQLKGNFFLDNEPENGLLLTKTQVKSLLEKATALHHRYISKTSDYTESLTDHYEQHFSELTIATKKVRNQLEDGVNRYGSDFEKAASASEKLYGVFSEKYKDIIESKDKIGADFENLRKIYLTRKYFDFDFPANLDTKNIRKISELAKDFEASLRLWRKRIPATVREDIRRLNTKSILFDLDFREQIKDLEYSMDIYLDEFNNTGLYGDAVKSEMLTIPKRQEFLEGMIAQLEETQFYLRDYNDFHIWQKHWLLLSPPAQKVVKALCKVKPKNWVAAFESWYLQHLLQNEYSPNMAWDDESLENWSKSYQELRRILPDQISAHWQHRKNIALRKLKEDSPESYKNWFGKNNRTLSVQRNPVELFSKHIDVLTETLPVLLVTPQVAIDVVRNSNLLFDLVLVDEGHHILKQECYHLFDMGKNIVVFGDAKQDMTPFAGDDILEFCKTIQANTITLDYQHQNSPEEWISFNKIAFDTPFKRLPYSNTAKDVTIIANVEGRYNESSLTNEVEARQIIDWLNLIEQTPAKTYPSVGIACATVQQRDLIANQLLKIRQRKAAGHEKIHQLYLNGLGVYQIGELQGQHVDILLLSLTFGIADAKGNLTADFNFWNTQLGMNQLHVALTRATQKIYIAHSIPEGLQTSLSTDASKKGTCIMANLVQFATQIQEGDHLAADAQLLKMKNTLAYPDNTYPSNIFMEEVEIALQPYFEPGRIVRNATVKGVTVPLLIHGTEESPRQNILLFDGVLAKSALPSYEWEEKLKQYCTKNQIEYVPTLSVQWWKAPKQEARKLAGKIISKDA